MSKALHTPDACLSMSNMVGYLKHELSPEEEGMVDEHLETCELCCGSLEKLSEQLDSGTLDETFANEAVEVFKEELRPNAIPGAVKDPEPWMNQPWVRIAAAILILFGAGVTAFLITTTPNYDDLFAEYFVPYEDIVTVRSGESSSDQKLTEAMAFYNAGAYEQSAELLDSISTAWAGNELVDLYVGISQLQLNRFDEAVASLKRSRDAEGLLQEVAEWYLALVYLKAYKRKDAAKLLSVISENDGDYAVSAQALLSELSEVDAKEGSK